MRVSANDAASYLRGYFNHYLSEYERFCSEGFPRIVVHPALSATHSYCYLAKDGAVLAEFSWEPPGWETGSGPGVVVCKPEPNEALHAPENSQEDQPPSNRGGLYEIADPNTRISDLIWRGRLPQPVRKAEAICQSGKKIIVQELDIDLRELLRRLTFGALCLLLKLPLPTKEGALWKNFVLSDVGFTTSDRANKRFFNHLEVIAHRDAAAWDLRSVWARVRVDIPAHFALAVARVSRPSGYITFDTGLHWEISFRDRLSKFQLAISQFEELLAVKPQVDEQRVHDFLKNHPIILDVYGEVISKPRFVYPPSESPTGKGHIEPDFLVKYPGNSYKVIEIERPSKLVATQAGQPRSQLTQSAFQISEFRSYIANHYETRLKADYPNINSRCQYEIVVGRRAEFENRNAPNVGNLRQLIFGSLNVDSILFYEDVLARAKEALVRLSMVQVAL